MKKNYLLFILLGLVSTSFYGCKKITDNTPPESTGYIQFKMDGMDYKFYDYNSNVGDGTATFSSNSTQYGLSVLFGLNFSNKIPGQSALVSAVSNAPIQVKNYSTNNGDLLNFNQMLNSYNHYTFVNKVTKGNVEITRMDTVAGGKIEGNFNFQGLYLKNENNTVIISTNHNVTEGSFSVVLDSDK